MNTCNCTIGSRSKKTANYNMNVKFLLSDMSLIERCCRDGVTKLSLGISHIVSLNDTFLQQTVQILRKRVPSMSNILDRIILLITTKKLKTIIIWYGMIDRYIAMIATFCNVLSALSDRD